MEGTSALPHTHLVSTGPEGAEPVLLLHGWGSSARLMQPIAAALESQYRVLNLDLPGHGHSPNPPEPWGVPEHAALVSQILDEHVGGPAAVIGHSNGGRIALYMASEDRYRRHFNRLVLVSPSGIKPERGFKYHLRRGIANTLKAPFSVLPGPLREFGLDWLRHSLVWRLLGSSDYRALEGVMRETFVRTVNFFVDDRLDRIHVPTLLFWGDQDTAVSRRQMEILERGIPDAGLVVLPGAGHYGYLDEPDTFVAATLHFLAETSPVTASHAEADPV
ncbi:MAG TPA: alpha/beta hydrolase [Rhodothermales bacterium]